VKKNPTEEKEEKLQEENQLKTNTEEAGKKVLRIVLYCLIIILVGSAVYYITAQNGETFKIFN